MSGSKRALHVIIVNAHRVAEPRDPDIFLNRHPMITGWAEALVEEGANVVLCQRFHRRAERTRQGVAYRFVAGRAQGLFRGIARLTDEVAALAHEFVDRGDVVVHVNGLVHPGAVRRLEQRLPPCAALLVQHHAERPGSVLRRALQRRAFRRVDGYIFAHRELARPWQDARVVPEEAEVHEVPAASSTLLPLAPEVARRRHGMTGDPVVLWTGDLDHNRDPLTVLAGFEEFLCVRPRAHLYMAFRDDLLKPEVEAARDQSKALTNSVSLLGERPYSSMHALFSAADIYVQGNHRCTGGIAVLDAMSCGAVPVVTRIPSFEAMLGDRDGNSAVGALWEPGDASACARALTRIAEQSLGHQRRVARDRFLQTWSWKAIGHHALIAYQAAVARRREFIALAATAPADSAS